MKKILTFLVALCATLSAASCGFNKIPMQVRILQGNGVITTREVAAADYHRIEASSGVDVIIDRGETVRITTDENIQEYVITDFRNGTLHISIDSKQVNTDRGVNFTQLVVRVPLRSPIEGLEVSSAATIYSELPLRGDRLAIDASSAGGVSVAVENSCGVSASSAAEVKLRMTGERCSIDASSAAEVDAELYVNDCAAEATSSAEIRLEGTAENLTASASSAGEVLAEDLVAKHGRAEASSGAEVEVKCLLSLDASASSGAEITYYGEPQKKITRGSSGGSINRR